MPHRSTPRGRVWKLTDLWTQRTRPQILAKPQNGFAQAPTRLIAILFHKNPKTRTPLGFSGQLPTDSAEEANFLNMSLSSCRNGTAVWVPSSFRDVRRWASPQTDNQSEVTVNK